MSRVGIDRVLRYAFELARTRPRRKLTSASKSNGIAITMMRSNWSSPAPIPP
jgi:tartrate dehydrogenase/decarboxylase / D-malate dehydrogenase